MTEVRFKKPVVDPDEPYGRIASRLRELLQSSDIKSSKELKRRTHYAGSTLSEAMSGRKRQSPDLIRGFVEACVPDRAKSETEIEELVAILEEKPAGNVPPVEVLPAVHDEHGDGEHADDTPIEDLEMVEDPRTGSGRPRHGIRGRWVAVAVVLALLVLIGAGYGLYTVLTPGACGSNADQVDGQCAGLTDGSVNLVGDPAFTDVLNKIKAENDKVLADPNQPVVSVAYVMPLPAQHELLSQQFVRELQGAYLMQLQRNERGQPNVLGGTPRLQLLVGNLGRSGQYSNQVVTQLGTLADPRGRAPVIAVAGLDQSLGGVRDAIHAIGGLKIPMVGARITGDDVSANPVADGFFAVSPSLNTQVAAIVNYLGPQPNILIVKDTIGGDLYGPTLAVQFAKTFSQTQPPGAPPLPDAVPFDSGRAGAQTAINLVNDAVCTLKPRAVFYAGRGSNLPQLVRALGTRGCKASVPVTVVTASDGHLLADAIQQEASTTGVEPELTDGMNSITFVSTAQAHPDLWTNQSLVPSGSHTVLDGTFDTAYHQQFGTQPGQPAQVDRGGDTVMGHDAMQVIVEAIVRSRPPQDEEPVTADLVRQALGAISVYKPVYGASGPIFFHDAGFAVNKSTPFTTIDSAGAITLGAPPIRAN